MDGAYKSFNSTQTCPPLMSKIFMLSRNFQLNFRVTVWKLILLCYTSSKFNKNCKQKRYAAVGFSGGKLKPLQWSDLEAGGGSGAVEYFSWRHNGSLNKILPRSRSRVGG